jgi:hypothetical protein
MTMLVKTAIAVVMIIPAGLSARSDEIPTLDVRPVCRGIAGLARDPLAAGLQSGGPQSTLGQCIQSEQEVRRQVEKEWSTFSAADKRHCVSLAKTGGESSYTELLTCLEMARDVRTLRSAAANPSDAAATQALSSPSPPTSTTEPPPAKPASPPPAANKLSKMEVDSTLKELTQAQTDARNARASEEMTRRRLADAETDLKRANEEAGRATQETQQAKADAQAARESQAKAENKLADAEKARMAAEGREQACQNAAKAQPGFGARLRSWFGHKPSNP